MCVCLVLEDHPPVPVMGFINKLMVMKTNDNQLFLEEFGSIPMTMPHLSIDAANLPTNKPRNRYNNILPYDCTRVKVKGHGTDYINANFCSVSVLLTCCVYRHLLHACTCVGQGYRKTKAYIATQGTYNISVARHICHLPPSCHTGPLQDTVSEFWRMVWEENVRTIVMLTNTQEKGKVCEREIQLC